MDRQKVALRVLAHFVPGPKVLDFLAPETDWLDIRWCHDDEAFYRELPEAEVIWHVLRPLSAADVARATRARLVHKFGAGVNTIDVDAATKHGIAVANMPGANPPSVAEGAVLPMLAALRRLSKLLAVSDIVSLHLPLTADTDGLIDRAALDGTKPGALLVNTSRGQIVDEDALADALRDGRLAAAGLDVFGVEPVPPNSPLLTPRVTWYTGDTMQRWLTEALNNPANCRRLGDGQQLAHVVNQPTGC